MNRPVRRVVTAQKPGGKSFISSDGDVPVVVELPGGMTTLFEIWKTTASPTRLRHDAEEPAQGPISIFPPKFGHVFRIVDIHPTMGGGVSPEDAKTYFEHFGPEASTQAVDSNGELMHRTETLDYGIVLEGEITLVTNEGETSLRQGDVVIQRGADHAWSNRSGKSCRMAFFMTSAEYPAD